MKRREKGLGRVLQNRRQPPARVGPDLKTSCVVKPHEHMSGEVWFLFHNHTWASGQGTDYRVVRRWLSRSSTRSPEVGSALDSSTKP